MNNSGTILLAYASRYGSTQEVAEAITIDLRKTGLKVDVRPMSEVKTVEGYDAVVLGAAIYSSRWHPDAHRFLSKQQEALSRRPVAIFALGPLTTTEAAMQRSRRQLHNELERYPWLKPVALEMFVGKIDPSKLGFFERFQPASDNRNWNAIIAWADMLPDRLQRAEILRSC
jgi:menaquinone-dependent protoporphyrinogen oxidase